MNTTSHKEVLSCNRFQMVAKVAKFKVFSRNLSVLIADVIFVFSGRLLYNIQGFGIGQKRGHFPLKMHGVSGLLSDIVVDSYLRNKYSFTL